MAQSLLWRWRRQRRVAVCFAILLGGVGSITQAWGFSSDQLTEPRTAQRIITLAPHLTELVFSAGAGDKLVGVIEHSDYPSEAQRLPTVGNYSHLNIEKIIALQPDLILGWSSGNRPRDLKKLAQLGHTLRITDIHRLEDIPQQIRTIGEIAGTEAQATAVAQTLTDTLAKLRQHYRQAAPISVFYQVWGKPYITVNGAQFISQGIEVCHGRNVFADLPSLSAEVGLESILRADPQVILLGGEANQQRLWLQAWQTIPGLAAVEKQQIYPLNSDWLQRPTARFIQALPDVCQTLDKARKAYGEGI